MKTFFSKKENLEIIKKLKADGLIFTAETKNLNSGYLLGKSFVLTGTLSTFSREDVGERITGLGGKITSSVSKKTNFVVAGENPGSKLEKAKSLGIKILNENEFIELLKKTTND